MARNRAVAQLATAREGAVTHAELIAAGLGADAIDHRVASGLLHRVHRGVFIVGHLANAPRANEMAALLACGEGALLSHRSAAAAWALAEPDPERTDVTVVGRRCRPKEGVLVHHVARLAPLDIRAIANLRLTGPARTLLDFAGEARSHELERAVAEGIRRKLVSVASIRSALMRAPTTHPGARALRGLMGRQGGPAFTRSEGERRMLHLLRKAELPGPHVNTRVFGFEVDFYWPDQRLVVEVDGHAFHGDRAAFERDRRKDQALVAAGLRVIRVTWRQIVEEPLRVVVRIAQALDAAPP